MEFQEDQRDKSNALAGPLVDQTQCAKFIICLAIFNGILYSMCQLSMAFQKDHVQCSMGCRFEATLFYARGSHGSVY